MQCEICGQEEAAFTIIPTGEGMPQSLGAACFARSGLELAKAILPAEEIAQTLGPMFVSPSRARALKKAAAESPQPQPEPEPKPEPAEEGTGDETDDEDKGEAV